MNKTKYYLQCLLHEYFCYFKVFADQINETQFSDITYYSNITATTSTLLYFHAFQRVKQMRGKLFPLLMID